MAIVLLTGAGLLIRSFSRMRQVNPGFPTKNLLTMQISLPRVRYQEPPQIAAGLEQVTDAVRRIPGVLSASATSSLPVGGGGFYLGRVFLKEGQPEPPASMDAAAAWSVVHPDYFQTMRIPIVAGRAFTDRDSSESTPVIIISQLMAQQMFPSGEPLGRRIRSWRDENRYREIVGVVNDLRYDGLAEDIRNTVYIPHRQDAWRSLVLVVRTEGDPNALLKSIRSQIWSIDKKLSISEIKTMNQIVDTELARTRFSMFLLGLFGATALVLAAIGIYGVMAYNVAQRTREIGVRMALGAARADVLRIVTGSAFRLASVGVLCGIMGALALTRLMQTLLFSVSPTDSLTFALVPAVLIFVTLAAAYVPARRATKVDPLVALRYE
jgi:putative ABC transport system permease protein